MSDVITHFIFQIISRFIKKKQEWKMWKIAMNPKLGRIYILLTLELH